MTRLLLADRYHFDPRAVPFMVAVVAIVAMMTTALALRGATILRLCFLGICLCLLPFVVGYTLAASAVDLEVVSTALRIGFAPTPLAAAFALAFDLALARKLAQHAALAVTAVSLSVAACVITLVTDWSHVGVLVTASGVPFGKAGWFAPIGNALIGLWVSIGTWILWRNLDAEPSALRRRQFKGAMWAFSISALGVVDLALAFGVGWYPVAWLFLTIGAVIALRSMIADDLIHAASLDRRIVGGLGFALPAAAALWWIARDLGDSPVVAGLTAVTAYGALRATHATAAFLARSSHTASSPLALALEQYGHSLQELRDEAGAARATREVLHSALGAQQVKLIVPSEDDYSWRVAGAAQVAEEETPDPLLIGWLVERASAVRRDDLVSARLGDLRGSIERLFDTHDAELIAPLANRDELVGLLIIGSLPGGRTLRQEELGLVEGVRERAAQALVYAAMWRRTRQQVEVAKQVELAATVQRAFVPEPGAARYGAVEVCGIYAPATRCGGDWWSAHRLARRRALIMIGDVTGHGVAAAMVTAAAKGCYDVALRLMGDDVDVVELMVRMHHAVRRTGGGQLNMTCFAALLDPERGEVSFANAGHAVPYVCRRDERGRGRLEVLVARGNPLGASAELPKLKAQTRPLAPGDLLVFYTDGIVECQDPRGEQWGDRRFQRILKSLAGERDIQAARDRIVREAATFSEGRPPDDDITLVVGRYDGA
jgi:serine phosphatase RsbU (regulator of sigma subunit)